MGEWTEVASAKRGVRGGFRDEVEEEESVELERAGVRLRAAGRRFSSRGSRVSESSGSQVFEVVAYLGEPWFWICVVLTKKIYDWREITNDSKKSE